MPSGFVILEADHFHRKCNRSTGLSLCNLSSKIDSMAKEQTIIKEKQESVNLQLIGVQSVVQYSTKYALLSKNMATSITRASTYPQPHSHTQKPPLLRSGMVPVDYEPRVLESGFGTAELGSDEDGSKHKVLGDLSVIPQVKAKFRTVLPTGRTKSLAWAGLGTRPGAPSGLVGLVGCAM